MAIFAARLWFGLTMLICHGLGKIANFNNIVGTFPDPIGFGSETTLTLVVFAEVVAALFLVVGLCTRLAALVLVIDMFVAYLMVHKAEISGQGSGELAFLYLAGYVCLLMSGGGLFSLDTVVYRKNGWRTLSNGGGEAQISAEDLETEGSEDKGLGEAKNAQPAIESIYKESKLVFLAGARGPANASGIYTTRATDWQVAWADLPEAQKREATHLLHSETEVFRIKSDT